MPSLSKSITNTLRFFLYAGLLVSTALAQQPEPDVTTLPAEDQAIIKGLRFRAMDAAPSDTRTATFIKGRLPIVNASSKPTIVGKLSAEARMPFRTPDKEWTVLRCRQDIVLNSKGSSELYISFGETNSQIEQLTGDKKAKVEDSITIIRYAGVKIFESEPSKAGRLPPEWWLHTGPLKGQGQGAPVATAEPVKTTDTSTGELKALRATTERALRAQIWKTYEQGVASLNARYLTAIDKALKTAQTEGQLDEALALRNEKDTVTKTGRLPASPSPATAPALAALRTTYATALTTLKSARAKASLPLMQDYNQKAELLIARLVKEGKLDEAKSARDSKDVPPHRRRLSPRPQPHRAAVDVSFVARRRRAKKEAHDLRTRICVLNGNEFCEPLYLKASSHLAYTAHIPAPSSPPP
ncbi:MAG: hypothetical protein NTY98_05295, partial [Verrucomicrobia bacterium]|nr:hypothetical protein [Verrucomicrobiota bacterium]